MSAGLGCQLLQTEHKTAFFLSDVPLSFSRRANAKACSNIFCILWENVANDNGQGEAVAASLKEKYVAMCGGGGVDSWTGS